MTVCLGALGARDRQDDGRGNRHLRQHRQRRWTGALRIRTGWIRVQMMMEGAMMM